MSTTRILGLVLMSVGFVGAAFASVRELDSAKLGWHTINWLYYAGFFAVGVAGVVLIRAGAQKASTHAHKISADLETIETALDKLVGKLDTLDRHRDRLTVFDVSRRIDEQLAPDLNAFVDARESLIHRYGLQPYADLMSEFAAGERRINRAWCASVDGYVDELWLCVERAKHHMTRSQELFKSYQQQVGLAII